jgi:hypothetical protein
MVIRLSSADALAPPVRRLSWFVVVVGVIGIAALVVLRVPLAVHVAYLAFFAVVAFVVYTDTLAPDPQTELHLDGRRLRRIQGLDQVGWQELPLPDPAVLVIDVVAGRHASCQLVALSGDARTVVVGATSYEMARGLGEALAQALGAPLSDLAGEPLQARAGALARAIEAEAPPARPWGASAWRDDLGLHLGLRAFGLAGFVIEMILVVPVLGFLFLVSGGNWGIPVLGLGLLALAFGARTHVDLTPRGASVRLLNAWLPLGQDRLLSWEEVDKVHVVADGGLAGIRFVTGAGSTFVPTPSRAAARWAAAEIRRYLLERAPR